MTEPERSTGKDRPAASAVVALLVLCSIWGYNWVVMKECLRYCGVFALAALRTGMAAAGLLFVLMALGRPLRPKALGMTIVLGLFSTTLCIGLVTLALKDGPVGKTALLVYLMPFWVLIMARPFLSEKVKGIKWVAVPLALAGLVVIMEPWRFKADLASTVYAVLAGAAWAAGTVVNKVMNRRRQHDLLSLTAWQMLLGSLPLVAAALIVPERPIAWTPYFLGGLIFSSLLSQALALFLWFFILTKLPAGTASLGTLITPVFGIAAASLELGERPSLPEAAGMVLIAAGLLLLALLGYQAQRSSPMGVARRRR